MWGCLRRLKTTTTSRSGRVAKKPDGTLRKWDDFKAEAAKINDAYNKRWLKTEYDQAVSSARAARKWQDIERTKSVYPHLEYRAVLDDRTRQRHCQWHGMILPIDHGFWNTHYPPNDYGCRCTVRRTDKPVDEKGYDVSNMPALSPQFNQNVGQSGKVFDKDHPYFKIEGYEKVARFANKALLGVQSKEISNQLQKARAAGVTYTSAVGRVTITNKARRKLLPKRLRFQRLLWDVKGLLKKAVLIKTAVNTKTTNHMVVRYHYLRTTAGDSKTYYLNVREMKTGEFVLYAITYNLLK